MKRGGAEWELIKTVRHRIPCIRVRAAARILWIKQCCCRNCFPMWLQGIAIFASQGRADLEKQLRPI